MTFRTMLAALSTALIVIGVSACGGGDETGPESGFDRPTVVSSTPATSATSVTVNSLVTVTFSKPMNPATLTGSTFVVQPATVGTISVANATVTFSPSAPLEYGTDYTVTVTTGARDTEGQSLASNHSFVFATVENHAPVAAAGANQDVSSGENVVLDGSGSTDPDGHALEYTWTQTAGADVTGGAGTLSGASPSFAAPAEPTTLRFELVVRDVANSSSPASEVIVFVLEDPARAVWVSTGGDDDNPGTRAAPMATLQAAVLAAAADSSDIYAAQGTYTGGTLELADGVSIYGGYDAEWVRDPNAHSTYVSTGSSIGVQGDSVSGLTISGLSVFPASAQIAQSSTYGFFLRWSSDIRIVGNRIEVTGSALSGPNGAPGAPGADGNVGQPGGLLSCTATLPAAAALGGEAVGNGHPGANGGRGGTSGGGQPGANGGPVGGDGGTGGSGGSVGTGSGGSAGSGVAGDVGADGSAGSFAGLLSAAGFVPGNGSAGGMGAGGSGGGGGGGSGGYSVVSMTVPGNGGGGGGSGGSGGAGGAGGGGAGGNFGIVLVGVQDVTIENNAITTGPTGNGGSGGAGGLGGVGQAGGVGATYCDFNYVGSGGDGGAGGNGGKGGQGGGGAGGPSIGIAEDATSTGITMAGNAFNLGSPGTGGMPNGVPGLQANHRKY